MQFPTTHWSALARASLQGEAGAQPVLEELCRRYWRPVRDFIRSRGVSDSEAEDLTQEFLVHVLGKSLFSRADRLRGQFRSFLLGALVRFLWDSADRRNALKRGGTVVHLNLESTSLDDTINRSIEESEAARFDREWALTILEKALAEVQAQYGESARDTEFGVLKNFLPGGQATVTYEEAASRLSRSVPAFKSEVHRLRIRFRQLVRAEVARTVSAPHEIEGEMAHLGNVLMDKATQFDLKNET